MIAQRPYAASELQEQLSISRANLSQHMTILRAAGVIITHREGKQVYCSLAIPEVKQACQLIRNVLRAQIRSGQQLAVWSYSASCRSPIHVIALVAAGRPKVVTARSAT